MALTVNQVPFDSGMHGEERTVRERFDLGMEEGCSVRIRARYGPEGLGEPAASCGAATPSTNHPEAMNPPTTTPPRLHLLFSFVLSMMANHSTDDFSTRDQYIHVLQSFEW